MAKAKESIIIGSKYYLKNTPAASERGKQEGILIQEIFNSNNQKSCGFAGFKFFTFGDANIRTMIVLDIENNIVLRETDSLSFLDDINVALHVEAETLNDFALPILMYKYKFSLEKAKELIQIETDASNKNDEGPAVLGLFNFIEVNAAGEDVGKVNVAGEGVNSSYDDLGFC